MPSSIVVVVVVLVVLDDSSLLQLSVDDDDDDDDSLLRSSVDDDDDSSLVVHVITAVLYWLCRHCQVYLSATSASSLFRSYYVLHTATALVLVSASLILERYHTSTVLHELIKAISSRSSLRGAT